MSQSASSVVTFPVLFADIGGTNARFALLTDAKGDIRHFDTVETRLFPTIEDAIQGAVIDAGAPVPKSLVFALAGPIGEESTHLTNCPWVVTPKRLIERFRLQPFIVTLAGMLVFRGLTLWFLGGMNIGPFPVEFQKLSTGFLPDLIDMGELHSTSLLLTLAVGCFIVRVMKGPAYVADAYEMEELDPDPSPLPLPLSGR